MSCVYVYVNIHLVLPIIIIITIIIITIIIITITIITSIIITDNRQIYKLEEPRRVTLKDMQRERKELMKGTSALGVVQQ
jgi:uncharacterized membrane protein